jgi:hypothetical protein
MKHFTFRVHIIGGDSYTKTVSATGHHAALNKVFRGMFSPKQRRDAHIDWLGDPAFTVFAGGKQFARITQV